MHQLGRRFLERQLAAGRLASCQQPGFIWLASAPRAPSICPFLYKLGVR